MPRHKKNKDNTNVYWRLGIWCRVSWIWRQL